ncbi:phenylalanine--tRNA ligase subunit beta [Caloramator proteoclasticus]|uniref:Phenylalanine--tRNA ligase beta subunit n=1 Tax=Caloramator proteoclasticus DSM 10124 TaxID=1121262 RepID=A0A1M4XDL1_9CLOT|nr:phenylalanine--tRNA ligase subunit beta [Caloramator proteoclasticus]SHE91528.1 phenylalanyl-tRNA synthetase beta subunit [Caloramator proteoclasticus DSM 10124]
MKVPFNWLLEYVDLDKDINEVAEKLTLTGSKVEEVIEKGKEIDKVVTGKIIKTEKHPNADKLTVCQVDVKDEVIQIVTGADNIKEGDIIPVALHGSTLPGGVKIKKGKLRGVESNGMLCSEAELGLADEDSVHGIMILDENTPIGVDIKEILGLNGGVIDFEITSNRADCFSVYGIARETAASFGCELKKLDLTFNENSENIEDFLKVEVKTPLCRRYMAKMIKNIKVGPSPEWMQAKLQEAGVRPINNVVDITNYVMLELGQPMHAFDYENIEGKKIVVKMAEDERFTTLDGVERQLDSSMITINDAQKTIAIAGVMGGQNSEVTEETNTIILECASFDGVTTRLTSKRLGLRTEASSRFEKDLDPNLVETALKRACHLFETLKVGEVVGGVIDCYEQKLEPHYVKVSPKWVNDFLGTDIVVQDMVTMLQRLDMEVEVKDELIIKVPTFRQDVKIKEDVAEEIARLYGYDVIPTQKIVGEAVEAEMTKEQKLIEAVKRTMVSSGLYETLTYSFFSPKVFDKINLSYDSELRNVVTISNPLGEDFSVMRTTLIPSMLEVMQRNILRDNKEVGLFDIGKVYLNVGKELPDERYKLCVAIAGDVDFFNLKGIVENLINVLSVDKAEFERETENSIFHPGRCAKLLVRKRYAGVLGEVHPDVLENYDLETRVYIAEIDLATLFEAAKMEKKYKPLPKYPAVLRDIALLVKDEVEVKKIEDIMLKQGKGIIEEIKLFDVYKGKQIPEGFKSVAYSIIYRAEDRTLTDEEINKVHNAIVKELEERLEAKLR